MVKLTERLVLARSRASDLENVRKLNCWASDLVDVSIIRKMVNVQIVSLSVNRITTLEDFSESNNLEELYIRKNNISNLAEICYLRKLPRLRVLWLADNPCAIGDRYRMTVLKTLPNLQRLDNIPVQEDEVNEAIEQGLDLTLLAASLKSTANPSPKCSPAQSRKVKKAKESKESVSSTPKEEEVVKQKVLELEDGAKGRDVKASVEEKQTSEENDKSIEPAQKTEETSECSTPTDDTESQSEEKSETKVTEVNQDTETKKETSSESEVEEEIEADLTGSDELEEGEVILDNPVQETNEIRKQYGLKPLSAEKVAQPTVSRPSHAAKARNSNILQAVLHLIKELDVESLEIVSDVVHSRLETL